MKISRLVRKDNVAVGWVHWCPGCESSHAIYVEEPQPHTGARWTFDGNVESPTFSPSILCFTTDGHWDEVTSQWVAGPNRKTLCHYFVRSGQLEYCGDSPHALAGKTVPMVELDDVGRPIL